MGQNRNILFIVMDQLRADCVSGALAAYVDLPNIRALAADGVSFARHFSVTSPCGPARASILTGQYAMNHRSVRNGTPLRHDTPNLASELRRGGWLPLLFGYTDTSQDPRAHPPGDPALTSYEEVMPGFQEACQMRMETLGPWHAHLRHRGYGFDGLEDLFTPVSANGGPLRLDDPALYAAEDSDTAFLTDAFLDHLRAIGGESWCAHLTYIRPHPPLTAPAPYNTLIDPASLPLPLRPATPEAADALHPFLAAARAPIDSMVKGFPGLAATDANVRQLRATYLGLAAEVDHHLGRVIGHLQATGQYDRTLIVLTADHGEMLGDHFTWGKSTLFDAAYHTTLIIRAPGHGDRAGTEITKPSESIDITPTILDWAGLAPPGAMDGRSLLPLIAGETPEDWRDHTFSELDFGNPITPTGPQTALGTGLSESNLAILREENLTLVQFATDLPPILFDHAGTGEFANRAAEPGYAPDLVRLTRKMLRHRMRHMNHTLSMQAITPDGPKSAPRYPQV